MKNTIFNFRICAAMLLLAATATACKDDIQVGLPIDKGAYDPIYENNVVLQDAATSQSAVVAEIYGEQFASSLKVSLTKAAESDVTLQASIDEAWLTAYNEANGTEYEAVPADLVSFGSEGVFTIAAGAREAALDITIAADDRLDKAKRYAVPVGISTTDENLTIRSEAGHCLYVVNDQRTLSDCFKGDDLPKGFLFLEVNDTNPLNALAFELENGKLIWDAVVLFAANINWDGDAQRAIIKCNPNVQFLLDNNETYLQPLRKRGIKVILGLLGNHDMTGLAQLSDMGAKDYAAQIAQYCYAYNLDGVNFDDEYSKYPDLSNPYLTSSSTKAAARLCYETKLAMPDKLVTVFAYGQMYGQSEVDGVDADEWIDIAVANYGSRAYPVGKMSYKKCSGVSVEFNLGIGSFASQTAQSMLEQGYGWYMGFASDPKHFTGDHRKIAPGIETLFGSPLKEPSFYYKKNDPNPYPYPMN